MLKFSIARNFRAALLSILAMTLVPQAGYATTVRMHTVLGPIDIKLYDRDAPQLAISFLSYVDRGVYNNSALAVPGYDDRTRLRGGFAAWDDASDRLMRINPSALVGSGQGVGPVIRRSVVINGTADWFIQSGAYRPYASQVVGEVTVVTMKTVDAILALAPSRPFVLSSPGAEISYLYSFERTTFLPLLKPMPYLDSFGGPLAKSNLPLIQKVTVSPTSYQGMWWNPAEDGWGMSIMQNFDLIFAALYTYDDAGQPIWYAMPNCKINGSTCSSEIYKVTGGTPPNAAWNGAGKKVTSVGSGTLTFSASRSAKFDFTLNGRAGSNVITQQKLSAATPNPRADFSGMWWNPAEDGWGLAVTHEVDKIFAAWYTYDSAGNPIWYVTDCAYYCIGSKLYRVTGGTPITSTWNSANKKVEEVGTLNVLFTAETADMQYAIQGQSGSRQLVPQPY